MFLAIDQQSGVVLESSGGTFYPVQRRPIITFAAAVDEPSQTREWAGLPGSSQFGPNARLALREDQFDPVTRTRRGRLYELSLPTQPSTEPVSGNTVSQRPVWKYEPPTNLLNKA